MKQQVVKFININKQKWKSVLLDTNRNNEGLDIPPVVFVFGAVNDTKWELSKVKIRLTACS